MLQNMDSRACLPIRPACPHEPEHLTLVIDFCKKWWTHIATKEMAFIGIVTLAASLVASWLKQFPGFSLFGALIIALLIDAVAYACYLFFLSKAEENMGKLWFAFILAYVLASSDKLAIVWQMLAANAGTH